MQLKERPTRKFGRVYSKLPCKKFGQNIGDMTTGQTAGSEETEINEDSGSGRVVSGTFFAYNKIPI